jgi:allophanate hydrolase subunit 1
MTHGPENAEIEFARYRFRQQQLLDTMRDLDEEETRLQAELARVDQQVAYYESLARDMKGAIRPAKLSSLLTSFGRGR